MARTTIRLTRGIRTNPPSIIRPHFGATAIATLANGPAQRFTKKQQPPKNRCHRARDRCHGFQPVEAIALFLAGPEGGRTVRPRSGQKRPEADYESVGLSKTGASRSRTAAILLPWAHGTHRGLDLRQVPRAGCRKNAARPAADGRSGGGAAPRRPSGCLRACRRCSLRPRAHMPAS